MSERVTWETCPECRRPAAVGWVDGDPVQFDCPRECTLSAGELRAAPHAGTRGEPHGSLRRAVRRRRGNGSLCRWPERSPTGCH